MHLTVGAAPVSVWSHGYAVSALQPTSAIRSIPFLFIHFRTLLRNGDIPTPFLSITCALFPVQWGVGVHCNCPTSRIPYILPSYVCSKPFCSSLLQNCRGVESLFPKSERLLTTPTRKHHTSSFPSTPRSLR